MNKLLLITAAIAMLASSGLSQSRSKALPQETAKANSLATADLSTGSLPNSPRENFLEAQRDMANLAAQFQSIRSQSEIEFQLRADVSEIRSQMNSLNEKLAAAKVTLGKECEEKKLVLNETTARCQPAEPPKK